MKRLLLHGVCALALLALPLFAQTTGSIKVTVKDKSGSPLPGAVVLAESPDFIAKRSATTREDGSATLVALDPAVYDVTVTMTGFQTAKNKNVQVNSGEVASLRFNLAVESVEEELVVISEAPVVDVTQALTSQNITLELTESLPTGRSYQSYLQLVPGVLPDDFSSTGGGNPASRSGLAYRDIGGEVGDSRDNFYYIEGINVTDPVTGTFGANLNTEIIQEQKVITGGVPAEFVGAPGLVSNVITKSGGNEFTGSLNYYHQDDSLVGDNDNRGDENFSTFDTAFTLGGPVIRDKMWFFASYRLIEREDDVVTEDTGDFLRTVTRDDKQFFGKLTWQATNADKFTLSVFTDPTERDGSTDRTVTNARNRSRDSGGDRFILNYQHVFSNSVLEASYSKHNGEVSDFSAGRDPSNEVIFLGGNDAVNGVDINVANTLFDQQLGAFGEDIIDERDNDSFSLSYEIFVDSPFGNHTLKIGAEFEEHNNYRDRSFIGGSEYTSIDSRNLAALQTAGIPLTAGAISDLSWTDTQFDVYNTSDFNGLINTINARSDRESFYALMDTDGDGVITPEEAASAIVFSSTAGNPNGMINYDRTFQSEDGAQETKSEGTTFYIQDTWDVKDFHFNIGIRAERWEHFATTGQEIYTFDWEIAPRLSATWDINGEGRQKVSAYYGRYYDPIRNNMTNFAGSLSGRVREEQVFINDEWLTYRTRGGPQVQDAFFAPTTETPYTDEFTLGYALDFGNNMSLEVNLIKRQVRDILEDYDLSLYAIDTEGNTAYPGPIDDPDTLFLGLDYFGYDENPGSNFVIATLAGGKRDYEGMEVIFRKRFSNGWQVLSSYNRNDMEGNTNSDSNADFQGDVIWLDPRSPNQFGRQPGLIENLFKAAASYEWDNGLQVGGSFRWNSGIYTSRTRLASRRHLPVLADEETTYAGITRRWLEEGAVGAVKNPSFSTLDLRAQYRRDFGLITAEFFLDVFNALDDQDAILLQDLVAGQGATGFGDAKLFQNPRRFYLGMRALF
ncbi:carboxypeptidase regulatory-like domain-containing protein [Acanthopleuribacter pedis]|uniref:Carboxypeptidase regulatory-like domain-containing protein n=1 Tax=Acanthopleuribacter pedis TaxID=442870 RepID=A0A8J7QK64_9BACT|nr:carboxypeptidase regulatory-like domain-containing protein [Acanthopleuribacter pedis]MBO1319688.1 carboxypeptidase regulatory-like domain-containing protein [Acanthopleuribacter pedis]